MSDIPDADAQRGLAAVESDDLEGARKSLSALTSRKGENDADVLHLQGMIAWAEGDIEHAAGYLLQAVDEGPTNHTAYLDCAELLIVTMDDLSEAEACVRTLLELPKVAPELIEQAKLLLAQIRLDHEDSDAEEALELLDQVASPELRIEAYYQSLRAAALTQLDRADEAIDGLRQAIAASSDDADLHYQLAVTLRICGREAESATEFTKVLHLDAAANDGTEPEFTEVQELRRHVEDILEDLPEPVLKRLASAPITVQRRLTAEQAARGGDPRSVLVLDGLPASHPDGPELHAIIVARDVLVDQVDDDDEIDEALAFALTDELGRMFQIEDIALGDG